VNLNIYTNQGVAGVGLAVILAILVCNSVARAAKPASHQGAPAMEASLQEARTALDNSNATPEQLRQVIDNLEKQRAKFPHEYQFPLYLAEAYYRLANPDADVNREFPTYEKTEKYAREAMALEPNRPEANYWYGLFLLKKAQKQGGIGAYSIVKKGIAELEKVRCAMPTYDHAGAARVLGLMYLTAPGWTPFGNVKKAVELESEATRQAPDYILNRLYLANALNKQGDKNSAIKEYREVLTAAEKEPGQDAKKIAAEARNQLQALGGNM
jgi:tetratricopeptide (TPR) repeat protein